MKKQLFFSLLISSCAYNVHADSLYHKILHAPCALTKTLVKIPTGLFTSLKSCPYVKFLKSKNLADAATVSSFIASGVYLNQNLPAAQQRLLETRDGIKHYYNDQKILPAAKIVGVPLMATVGAGLSLYELRKPLALLGLGTVIAYYNNK